MNNPSQEYLLDIARQAAESTREEPRPDYLPKTLSGVLTFQPHAWVLDAMNIAYHEGARAQKEALTEGTYANGRFGVHAVDSDSKRHTIIFEVKTGKVVGEIGPPKDSGGLFQAAEVRAGSGRVEVYPLGIFVTRQQAVDALVSHLERSDFEGQ